MDVKIIKMSDVARCPVHSLLPQHYNADGTCVCTEQGKIARRMQAGDRRKF